MLVILSGVSGAGKDTIKKELLKRMEDVVTLPSFTSRERRPIEEEGVQYHFITKESSFAIHKLLHELEEPYKEVFELRVFGELSFAEIAEIFGRTESWARVTYHRAKLKIKERMD